MVLKLSLTHEMFQKVELYQFTGFWELSKKFEHFSLCRLPAESAKNGLGSRFSSFSDILVVLKLSLTHEMLQKVKSYHFTGFWEVLKNLDVFQLVVYPKKCQKKQVFIIFGYLGGL